MGLALASYAGYVGWNPPHPTEADDPDLHAEDGAAETGSLRNRHTTHHH